jgi:hypothetical protein
MSKGDKEWQIVKQELEYRTGRVPTDKEIQLELDIRLIDSAGGKISSEKGKHRKK